MCDSAFNGTKKYALCCPATKGESAAIDDSEGQRNQARMNHRNFSYSGRSPEQDART
jgi:hypothetical protein